MNDCACICEVHSRFATVRCTERAAMGVLLRARVGGSREVNMCEPCARWWISSQTSGPDIHVGSTPEFSGAALWNAVSAAMAARGDMSYREVAAAAGINPNTLSRLRRGGRPDVTGLARLLVWLGDTDIKAYLNWGHR